MLKYKFKQLWKYQSNIYLSPLQKYMPKLKKKHLGNIYRFVGRVS